ncbi:hypothetical protein A3B84_01550 [Candidatus Nomurabacteria bacterium RIFCSPHIGHO2_02_FULL_35_13]|uniref:DUF1573 domain-containing protein n=2 Tax=Candidatus Nomuraibacteriota TaxID=1752729 RepID=A0A1F6VND4_9BACT|nr:MAG: hypothetical protein UR88_C0001G0014 [Candidatus Nomurabacteria bacterium GW2011_GWA1_35_8]OGI71197.1 MAG: hypothetical protein A3B84_01550 [Candidatus Nomurabacteria bacterium RIFCSPHIGHO2_02_FULL_35_13]
MKTKNIIYTLVVILLIAGFYIWGYSTKGGTAGSVQGVSTLNVSKGSLIATEKFYDFGAISMKNGNVVKEFTVTNFNDGDIILSKVLTSCMCTSAYIVKPDGTMKGPFGMSGHGAAPLSDEAIKPGENRIVRVVFDPNAHGPAGVGMIDRFITLTDTSDNTLQFEVKALVTP